MEETVSTITVGVITDLAKDGIKYVCEKLNDYRKEINAMDSIDFGDAYETLVLCQDLVQVKMRFSSS